MAPARTGLFPSVSFSPLLLLAPASFPTQHMSSSTHVLLLDQSALTHMLFVGANRRLPRHCCARAQTNERGQAAAQRARATELEAGAGAGATGGAPALDAKDPALLPRPFKGEPQVGGGRGGDGDGDGAGEGRCGG